MTISCTDVNARLARACARGWRQEQLVTELLTGHVDMFHTPFGVNIGKSGVSWASYRNLRSRLITAGFLFEKSAPPNRWVGIKMTYPEHP